MKKETIKIGLGGSCHWCTEAIFLSLVGIEKVEQGWISSVEKNSFSEAIIVHFNASMIELIDIIQIHLYTHSSTHQHSMRSKYRSAIYCFDIEQQYEVQNNLNLLQEQFEEKVITEALRYQDFKLNKEEQLNYYYSNPEKPFCKNIINPKLRLILNKFGHQFDKEKRTIVEEHETRKTYYNQ